MPVTNPGPLCPCRMTHYFDKVGWPAAAPTDPIERKEFVAGLHKRKTKLFMDLIEKGSLPLRPGVARFASIRIHLPPSAILILAFILLGFGPPSVVVLLHHGGTRI